MNSAQTESIVSVGNLIASKGKFQLVLSVSETQTTDAVPKTLYGYDFIWLNPEDPEDVAAVKLALFEAIKTIHDQKILDGYMTSFGFRVDIEPRNVTDWSASLQMLQISGAEQIDVCDYDNRTRMLTSDQYRQMCLEIGAYLMALRAKKWEKRGAVNASETIAEAAIAAADWS